MEEELKCAVCKQLFANPVLLPCYHSTCLNCAVQIQSPVHQQSLPATSNTNLNGHHSHVSTTNFHGHSHHIVITTATVHHNNNNGSTPLHQNLHHNQGHHNESNSVNSFRADSDKSSTTSSTSSQTSGGEDSSDKVSVLSETDSGVVICSNSSRPNSYVSSHNMHGLLFPPIQSTSFCLSCPVCHKTVYFDENGAHNLPKYRVMQNIVDRWDWVTIYTCMRIIQGAHMYENSYLLHYWCQNSTEISELVSIKRSGTSIASIGTDYPSGVVVWSW